MASNFSPLLVYQIWEKWLRRGHFSFHVKPARVWWFGLGKCIECVVRHQMTRTYRKSYLCHFLIFFMTAVWNVLRRGHFSWPCLLTFNNYLILGSSRTKPPKFCFIFNLKGLPDLPKLIIKFYLWEQTVWQRLKMVLRRGQKRDHFSHFRIWLILFIFCTLISFFLPVSIRYAFSLSNILFKVTLTQSGTKIQLFQNMHFWKNRWKLTIFFGLKPNSLWKWYLERL